MESCEVFNKTSGQCPDCGVWPGQYHNPDCPVASVGEQEKDEDDGLEGSP